MSDGAVPLMNDDTELDVYDMADALRDPLTHATHHLMRIKEDERFDSELEQLRNENVELLRRVEKLENALWGE